MNRRDELIKQLAELRTDPNDKRPLIDDAFLFKGRNGQEQGDFSKCRQITITIPHPPQKQVCTSTTPVKEKSGKKGKRRLSKIISLIGLSGVTVLGSIAMVVDSNKPASLDEILEIETPKSLGISENTQETLAELRSRKNKNLNREEIIELAYDIINFEKDTIKSKIAHAFDILGNPIYTNDISLIPEQVGEHNVQIVIDGIGIYEYEEQEAEKEQEYTISEDIAKYITGIVAMQGYESDLISGVKRTDFQEEAKKSLEEADKFAAGKIEIDENGNITIKYKTKGELLAKKRNSDIDIIEDSIDDEYDR